METLSKYRVFFDIMIISRIRGERMKIFVDTCIYINSKYNFNEDSDFGRLLRHAKQKKYDLVSTELTNNEIKKHINISIEEVYNGWKSMQKNAIKYRGLNGTAFAFIKTVISKEDLVKETQDSFGKYIQDSQMTIYGYSKLRIESVMDAYFKNEAPFELNDKKKNEFPDAIVIDILKNEIDLVNNTLIVITEDKGFSAAFSRVKNVLTFKKINDYLDSVNRQEALYNELIKYYSDGNNTSNITNQVKNFIENNYDNIDIDGKIYDRNGMFDGYEYDEIEINSIAIESVKLNKVEEIIEEENVTKITAEFLMEILVDADCRFFDENNSIWNSEDKEYGYKSYGYVTEQHKRMIEVSFSLKYKNEERMIYEETIDDSFHLYLDADSLLSREEHLDDYYDYGLKVIKKVNCVNCSKDFSINFSNFVEETSSWDNGDDKMGVETQYFIEQQTVACPHCGKEYVISGSYNEYPEGALDLDETEVTPLNKID